MGLFFASILLLTGILPAQGAANEPLHEFYSGLKSIPGIGFYTRMFL
jgi:hypothetical protein